MASHSLPDDIDTMLSPEMLDVLTEEGKPTGEVKARALVHQAGDWHRCWQLWILKERKYVIMQRRASSKHIAPNLLDISVAGHVRAGETILDTLREAKEELGVWLEIHDIRFLHHAKVCQHYDNAINREVQDVYFYEDDRELWEYSLEPKEVYVIYEVPLVAAIALYAEGTPIAAAGFDVYGRHNNALLTDMDIIPQARADTLASLQQLAAWLETAKT